MLHNITRDEMETLMQLGNLDVQELMFEMKRLQNNAYQLGQEESKEMTRGNISTSSGGKTITDQLDLLIRDNSCASRS